MINRYRVWDNGMHIDGVLHVKIKKYNTNITVVVIELDRWQKVSICVKVEQLRVVRSETVGGIIILMSFFRSEPINYYKLVLPRESAWEIMNRLGETKLVHIVPSDVPVLTRPFITQVRRCEEALHKLTNLQKLLAERAIHQGRQEVSEQGFSDLYQLFAEQYSRSSAHPAAVLNEVVQEVDHSWAYYQDLSKRSEFLGSKMQAYRDNLAVIHAGERLFGRSFFTHREQRAEELGRGVLHGARMNFKCGVISIEEELRFKKTVFRITKGNSLVSCLPFRDLFPHLSQSEQSRVAFFVLFPGRNDSYLERKLARLMESFGEANYELPSHEGEFEKVLEKLQRGFNEAANLEALTQEEVTSFLRKLAEQVETQLPNESAFRRHEYLRLYLLKEKELYSGLNEMEFFNNFLQGRIYVRTTNLQALMAALRELETELKLPAGQLIQSSTDRFPTYYQRNDFTRSAQEIVETYGVARYQEANPAFFTVVTFPFLFGVMFGDIGHGLILFGFGLYLVWAKERIANPLMRMLLPHRYMLTLMGFFATYCGFIYNDYLSTSLNLFGSCYTVEGVTAGDPLPIEPDCVYPFGLDPAWSIAENNLNFVNSLKMKISVIIGVTHMTLGVFVKALNTLHFGRIIEFFFEFLPQLAFMVLLFGYMDFLIIYKWNVDWTDPSTAPSIITTMINMPLKMGKTDDCCGGQPMWGTYGDTSQDTIQKWFLVTAILCIPLMLFPKPLYEIYCRPHPNTKQRAEDDQFSGRLLDSSENLQGSERGSVRVKQEDHGSDEIFVHQLIETIEYVLGCISNTASYLRLWALSLAHSQLSEVFFEYLVEGGIISGFSGIPAQLLGFVFLAGITFGVLLCMDSLECFLHTLRLHWVQFNSKFYKGDGFAFTFYSFSDRLSEQLQLTAS